MEILIKQVNSQHTKIISLEDLSSFQIAIEKFFTLNEPIEANIFAINETINAQQLEFFLINLEKLNFNSLNIWSNIRETVLTGNSLKINSIFASEKVLRKRLYLNNSKKEEDVLHKGTVRSGERISSNGDLVVIGDVNPGAIISAKKNIYVWGKMLGIAQAGNGKNHNSSIASLFLKPLQLRINEVVAIGPKDKPKDHYPEIAILEKNSIIIKPYFMVP